MPYQVLEDKIGIPVGVGLVGAGAFGEFCLAAFADMRDVRIAAVCDTNTERAEHFAKLYNANAYTDLDKMLEDPAVEIVALNTPPYLHAEQGLAVLNAGKHLFCEKPLALTIEDGQALIDAAERNNVLLSVDYVMRHNPCWDVARWFRESDYFGELLHMDLTNHAAGLDLPADHWFWDKSKSGGIWIEHGVHFFDAFSMVTGTEGMITSAHAFRRADGREDRVEALARYGNTSAHFYHGFTHSSTTERTTVRLTFEHAYVTLHGWIPTRMEIELNDESWALPYGIWKTGLQLNQLTKALYVATDERGKAAVYRYCIRQGILGLAVPIRYVGTMHITGEHRLASLKTAVDAERMRSQ
jgi:predicted dehydrogenase